MYLWKIHSVMQLGLYFDYLTNSQNERRITPEDYVRQYNEE